MIEIGAGVELGPGTRIGAVSAVPGDFVTEVQQDPLVTETGDQFIEE